MTKLSPHILISVKKNRRSGNIPGGFTLIEALLAMTIFAFIGLGIATSFFSGVKLWQRAAGSDAWRNDIILRLESVSKELRQSIDMPVIGFEGNSKSFSFPYVSGNKIVMVSYSFDSIAKTLKRSECAVQDIIAGKKKTDVDGRDTVSFDEFSVQYLRADSQTKNIEWIDEWKKEYGIFIAIRFKGKFHDEEFQKTVFIPIA